MKRLLDCCRGTKVVINFKIVSLVMVESVIFGVDLATSSSVRVINCIQTFIAQFRSQGFLDLINIVMAMEAV